MKTKFNTKIIWYKMSRGGIKKKSIKKVIKTNKQTKIKKNKDQIWNLNQIKPNNEGSNWKNKFIKKIKTIKIIIKKIRIKLYKKTNKRTNIFFCKQKKKKRRKKKNCQPELNH
jgi:hypothetical protein